MQEKINEGLTFDDVLVVPRYSEILPNNISVKSCLSKDIILNIPLISAAMDTVTEARTAIAMAQVGGIGIIHKNMSIEDQVFNVIKVKKYEAGMITDPVTMNPMQTVGEAKKLMSEYKIGGFPVIYDNRKVAGIITNRDLRFEENMDLKICDIMTKENLITVPVGTTLDEAKKILQKYRIEKLLVVDKDNYLKGLITVKDIEKSRLYPNSSKDKFGRLICGASIGTSVDSFDRINALKEAGVDVIVIDTAHGHSKKVIDLIQSIKNKFSNLTLIAGNVATHEGAKALCSTEIDAIKVGIGPGSICTTRIIAGIGVPQITAILEVKKAVANTDIKIIADGGIKYSGDIVKAIAAGADTVMLGGLLAGTDESPGEMVLYQGRSYKVYRGMGSIEAMKKGSKDRYSQEDTTDSFKLVPEGIEGQVPYRGSLSSIIYQLVGGLKAGMGYVGVSSIQELQKEAKFIKITQQGLIESHPHNVNITKEAPNYRLGN